MTCQECFRIFKENPILYGCSKNILWGWRYKNIYLCIWQMLFLANTLDFIQKTSTFLWVTSWQSYSSKNIFWLIRFCTSNLDGWMEKEKKKDQCWKGQQLWASVNYVVSTYQIIRRLNQFPLCRTAELWEKTIMSFRQIFPWANIISTVESEGEQTLRVSTLPPSKTHADMKIKTCSSLTQRRMSFNISILWALQC